MTDKNNVKRVTSHYNEAAEHYHQHYDRSALSDVKLPYPANYFRLEILLESFVKLGLKRVVEVGVGEGTPLTALAAAGIDVWGFDVAVNMVEKCKRKMQDCGLSPDHVFHADIQASATYADRLGVGTFDGLMAMGVMPHIDDDDVALTNMAALVRPGGTVFVEFRNKLFSLFTFNRYTRDFVVDDLLNGVDDRIRSRVAQDLNTRLRIDQPPVRQSIGSAPGYDAILSKLHNPLEMPEFFARYGFTDVKLRWYHYHPSMPYLAEEFPSLFRGEAIRLEGETSGWRGFFLCSAFVVQATKSRG